MCHELEAIPMNQNRFISTAVLFLLLGMAIPAFAQKGQEDKGGGGGKAQQAQHQQQPQRAPQAKRSQQQPQHTQQAQRSQQQPQRTQQAQHQQQPQRAQQAHQQRQPQRPQRLQHQQQPQRAQQAHESRRQQAQPVAYNRGNNGNHYGRIPDDRYRAHFGHDHRFRMIRPRMIGGYQRFQYSGYWFGFNEAWPSDWYYTDDVYVEYVDNVYYLYNPRRPGIHITLNLF
jgi:hypothetical protein